MENKENLITDSTNIVLKILYSLSSILITALVFNIIKYQIFLFNEKENTTHLTSSLTSDMCFLTIINYILTGLIIILLTKTLVNKKLKHIIEASSAGLLEGIYFIGLILGFIIVIIVKIISGKIILGLICGAVIGLIIGTSFGLYNEFKQTKKFNEK